MNEVVNYETGELVDPMSESDARRLTERIRIAATNYVEAKEKVLALVDEAKAGHAHIALGYASWTAYLSDVLSDEPLRLARDERRELVTRLADEGMSTRAIAPIVGVHKDTIRNDLDATGEKSPVAKVRETTGLDGKVRTSVTAGQVRTPKRRPITDTARDAGWDLTKAVERLERIADDDRWKTSKNEVAPHLRSHLTKAVEVCQDLLDQLT